VSEYVCGVSSLGRSGTPYSSYTLETDKAIIWQAAKASSP